MEAQTYLRVICDCQQKLKIHLKDAGRTGRCPTGRCSIVVPPAERFPHYPDRRLTLAELTTPEVFSAPEDSSSLWREGNVIGGRYEVLGKLGEGTFGSVWKIRHLQWDRLMAVKQLKKARSQKHRDAFRREANAWADLGLHPNMVTAHYVDVLEDDSLYLFLEYVEGGDLDGWIEDGRTRDLSVALDIAIQLCWGLTHVHKRGVVHRDFKPQNVMMTQDGVPKVTDFGTVKFVALTDQGETPDVVQDIKKTIGGQLQGTPPYMPPEQWAKGGDVDHRVDLYALGVIIYELLTATFPIFPSEPSLAGWIRAHAEVEPPLLRNACPEVPEELEQLVSQLLSKNPDTRPENADQVASNLEKIYREVHREQFPRRCPDSVELQADTLNNRAVGLVLLGEEKDSLGRGPRELLAEAVRLNPDLPEALYNNGLLQWRAAEAPPEKSLRLLKNLSQSWPENSDIPFLLGLTHVEYGDAKHARKAFDEAIRLGGEQPSVRAKLDLVQDQGDHWGGQERVFEDHGGVMNSVVAYSPDGVHALSGNSDYRVVLWQLSDGTVLRSFKGHREEITSVVFSSDGRRALSGSEDKTIRLWDTRNGKCLGRYEEHTDKVTTVAFSPDGNLVLSGGADKTVRLWNIEDGKLLRCFEGHSGGVTSVAFTPDARHVISGSGDKTMRLWDIEDGTLLRTFEGHSALVQSIVVTPDGRFVLSGSWDHTLRLWNISDGTFLRSFEGHSNWVMSVVISLDGRFVISGSSDGTVRVWDLQTARVLRCFEGHRGRVTSVAFSPDSRFALSASGDSTVRLWRVGFGPSQELRPTVPTSADVAGSIEQRVEQLRREAEACALSSPAKAFETLREAMNLEGQASNLALRSLAHEVGHRSGRPVSSIRAYGKHVLEGHSAEVTSVATSRDGQFILSGSDDSTLRLWSLQDGHLLRSFEGHKQPIGSVAFSPDGKSVLSASSDRTLRLWDIATGELRHTFEGHRDCVKSGAFSPDARRVLSGAWDKTVRIWDSHDGKCLQTYRGHPHWVTFVGFSPDGLTAVSGGKDKWVHLWRSSDGEKLHSFGDDPRGVTSMAFSPDGRFGLSGHWNWILCLWDITDGKVLRTFEGHTDEVTSVAFSPCSRFALSGSADETVRLWNIETGMLLHTFEGHSDDIHSVAFSADGRFAISGSQDKTVRVWELVWDYEFPDPTDWEECARPLLDIFLTVRSGGDPSQVTEQDCQQLLEQLRNAALGWLRPEGVKAQLKRMITERTQ